MILGSHNSFTYLKPKHWWMYPFNIFAKCQSKDIIEQYNLGVRFFDLRIRFDKNNKLEVAHGFMSYDITGECIEEILWKLNFIAKADNKFIYVRLIHEDNYLTSDTKALELKNLYFIEFCKSIKYKFNKIKFVGGRRKSDWTELVSLNKHPNILDLYSSMTWKKLDDWCPWLYAFFMNKRNYKKYKNLNDDTYVLMDFVHRH